MIPTVCRRTTTACTMAMALEDTVAVVSRRSDSVPYRSLRVQVVDVVAVAEDALVNEVNSSDACG